MIDDNGKTIIDTLYNVLFTPYLCDKLFSIIKLMNSANKGFCTVLCSDNEQKMVTLPHSAQK